MFSLGGVIWGRGACFQCHGGGSGGRCLRREKTVGIRIGIAHSILIDDLQTYQQVTNSQGVLSILTTSSIKNGNSCLVSLDPELHQTLTCHWIILSHSPFGNETLYPVSEPLILKRIVFALLPSSCQPYTSILICSV